MDLASNGHPRWDAGCNQWFDGKLGLWPVAHQWLAVQRNSRHRPVGTLEWKSLSLVKVVYGGFLFNKVVPSSILRLWPQDNRCIQIQQDNATPHLSPEEFQAKWLELKNDLQNTHGGGLDWDFELYCQPTKSPDMNVNNLCFFASLQVLQYHNPTNSLHKMITRLRLIYEEYPRSKLNNSFLTLQPCMIQVIECNGGYDYRIEHMNKARLERLGLLPQSILGWMQQWIEMAQTAMTQTMTT
jgi:hypothetical protein